MLPLLTAAESRSADREAIDSFGIPSAVLMENAGRAVAAAVTSELLALRPSTARPATIVCGGGNNAGDGFVAARALLEAGYPSEVIFVGESSRLPDDARFNLDLLRRLIADGADVVLRATDDAEEPRIDPGAVVVVDALLGTGVRGEVRAPVAAWIDAINAHRARVVSADVPSGLDADTGRSGRHVVRADVTVTFGSLKTGLRFNDGPSLSGRVTVAPIGIPRHALDRRIDRAGCAALVTRDDVTLPRRPPTAHKYTSGALFALCGSVGMTGAAVLACEAAMRMGAGAVRCASGERAAGMLARRLTEVMTVPLREDDDGLDPDAASAAIAAALTRSQAAIIGCGCGRAPGTTETILRLLQMLDHPAVIDADALYAIAQSPSGAAEALGRSDGRWILTPHKGEFERIVGEGVSWDTRIDLARRYAREWNVVLLLKGLPSVVGRPDGRVFVGPSASTALATAGTGDVLAGMIAGLIARGLPPADAAVSALYVGGHCADRYAVRNAPDTLLATDLLAEIPSALRALDEA